MNFIRSLGKSFVYAWRGIVHGARRERNVQIHLAAAASVLAAGILTGLSRTEWMIVLILFGGMISLELMNTAIERVVDLVTDEYKTLARQAKDTAAGAVLVFAIMSAIIGGLLFIPKWFFN